MADGVKRRFLTLADAAQVLDISAAQMYALVRRGEIPAIKVGGRGQWRVEIDGLERYIAEGMASTRRFIDDHPYTGDRADTEADADAPVD